MSNGSTIRVLVADDHELLRSGVAKIIDQEQDMTVVAQANTGENAILLFEEHRPDVGLVDLSMPGMGGIEAIRQIKARDANARLIVLSTYDTDEDIESGLRAGAQAYLLKDVAANELVSTIRDVFNGQSRFAPTVAAKLASRVTRVQLTARELEVLKLVAKGKANREIADELHMSDGTVKVHLTHLFEKLSVKSRTAAIAEGLRRGLVRMS